MSARYDKALDETEIEIAAQDPEHDTPEHDPHDDETSEPIEFVDDFDPETCDRCMGAQVLSPKGDEFALATVKRRKRDENGNPIGRSNSNPILDARLHEAEFADGEALEHAANVIAENTCSQADEEGHQQVVLGSIVDHKSDGSAIKSDDQITVVTSGKRCRRSQCESTRGWKLCVQWKDGSTSWEPLSALKESCPLEVAEHAVNNKIASEPAFNWWVPFALRRRDQEQALGVSLCQPNEFRTTSTNTISNQMDWRVCSFQIISPQLYQPLNHHILLLPSQSLASHCAGQEGRR